MSSTGTWAALMPQPVASCTRWQMQPRSWMWGWLVFSLLMTELCRPFITLALSELKAIRLSHGMPLFLLETGVTVPHPALLQKNKSVVPLIAVFTRGFWFFGRSAFLLCPGVHHLSVLSSFFPASSLINSSSDLTHQPVVGFFWGGQIFFFLITQVKIREIYGKILIREDGDKKGKLRDFPGQNGILDRYALILLHWLAINCEQTACQSMHWRIRRT